MKYNFWYRQGLVGNLQNKFTLWATQLFVCEKWSSRRRRCRRRRRLIESSYNDILPLACATQTIIHRNKTWLVGLRQLSRSLRHNFLWTAKTNWVLFYLFSWCHENEIVSDKSSSRSPSKCFESGSIGRTIFLQPVSVSCICEIFVL